MDIWEINKLALFLLFFIPGFISIKVYQLLIASEKIKFSDAIAEAVGFSSLNFAFFSWAIILIHKYKLYESYPFLYYLISFLIIFITPIIWPILYVYISRCKLFRKYLISPIKSAWDFYFDKRKSCWVIINLKTNEKIGGIYSSKSFSSSYPCKEQIYLEELWQIDNNGKFIKKVDRSSGILISFEEIKSIEFYN